MNKYTFFRYGLKILKIAILSSWITAKTAYDVGKIFTQESYFYFNNIIASANEYHKTKNLKKRNFSLINIFF